MPKLEVPSLQKLQEIAWQLHYMAERVDGPAKAVLEQARDDISEIASEIYGN
jgi:hypothetical protein